MPYDPDLFAGAAAWYRRYRPPYGDEAFAHVIRAFGLDGTGRLLDLGCGPGILAVPLSEHVSEVLAMDPDADMLAEGRLYAAERGRTNITWMQAGSEDLSPALGRFRCAVMGQSFHWMDRDAVLRAYEDLLEDGGGFALINPGVNRPIESWEPLIEPIIARYLSPLNPPQRSPERTQAPSLARSRFIIEPDVEFTLTLARDAESVIGYYRSTSGAGRRRLGDRADAFDDEIRETLARAYPPRWTETLVTSVVIGRKPER